MPDADPHKTPNDADPRTTPGLEPGGGVPPGETPPSADQLSGAAASPAERESVPDKGPKLVMGLVILLGALVGALLLVMAIINAMRLS